MYAPTSNIISGGTGPTWINGANTGMFAVINNSGVMEVGQVIILLTVKSLVHQHLQVHLQAH